MSAPGDATAGSTSLTSKKDEYYAYMLLKERLMAQGEGSGLTGEAKDILSSQSQEDQIKQKILAKICHPSYAESTANYAQLVTYTGKRDKLAQAEHLSKIIFNSMETKQILDNLTGGSGPTSIYQSVFAGTNTRGGTQGAIASAQQVASNLTGGIIPPPARQ